MRRNWIKVGLVPSALGLTVLSMAQLGWDACIDPKNTTPFSNDYAVNSIGNDLIGVSIGLSGTVTYGGQTGPCFAPPVGPITANVKNAIGLFTGFGSVQSDFDDFMSLVFGAPFDAAGTYAYDMILEDGVQTAMGAGTVAVRFNGSSARYIYNETVVNNDVHVFQRLDVFGDATRVAWQIQNVGTATHTLGLYSGKWMAMLDNVGNSAGYGYLPINGNPTMDEKNLFVTINGLRPPITERRFIRANDPSSFPTSVNFDFGQTNAYGMRLENGPIDENGGFDISMNTYAIGGSPAVQGVPADTQADEFVIGQHFFLMGPPGPTPPAAFPDFIFPVDPITGSSDVPYGDDAAYIQKFYDQDPVTKAPLHPIAPGTARVIVQYFRSTWGVSNYIKPYVVVVDAPKLLSFDPTNPNNQISPNPMTVRIDVDNTYAYADVATGVPIVGQVTVKFAKSTGLTFLPGQGAVEDVEVLNGVQTLVETCTKATPNTLTGQTGIQPSTMGAIDFQVQSDGIANGAMPYYVTTNMTPGGTKTITGTIYVSTTPRLVLRAAANLVSVPWTFGDTSWTNVLGLPSSDFTAYTWDPVQMGYVVSTSQKRGQGVWIITNADFGSLALNPSAQQPPDSSGGAGLFELKSGWNLIANPYNFPIQLGQLVGVPGANNTASFTYEQLVNQGTISGGIAFWDPDSQSYQYITGNTGVMESNKGYWIYVFTSQDVTMKWPPVFQEFAPNITGRAQDGWNKSEGKWRLNLAARSAKTLDDQNYVGVVSSASDITMLSAMKPPLSPTQDVALSIEQPIQGKKYAMAQAYNLKGGNQQWNVSVQSLNGGSITITWPNMTSTSTNTRFRITDVATNTSRDMRQTSGYTFIADKNSTRKFTIQAVPGGASRAIIGNVTVSRPSRAPGAAFAISYSLSSAATTSIRVLSSSGKEVFTITPGRADNVGQNMATWALKDNANRAVAPGTYRIEIVAETPGGDRVRKIVPVNVIR